MTVIGIGASRSGAGKTHMACALISELARRGLSVGAIKCTPHALYSSITGDPAAIEAPGKDTALLKASGATGVLWAQTSPGAEDETLRTALTALSAHEAVIVEGNSAIEVLKPDIVLFIIKDGPGAKQSAPGILALADVVLLDGDAPAPTALKAGSTIFRRDGEAASFIAGLVGKAR